MTDDLVKRLLEPVIDPFFGPLIEPIKKEAADRIEQLEAALRSLFGTFMELNMAHKECDCHECSVIRAARAALGEKKDD